MKIDYIKILGLSLLVAVGASSCKKEEQPTVKTVQKVILDKSENYIQKGHVAYITAVCKPSDADNTDVGWTSADTNIVKVFADKDNPNRAILYAVELGKTSVTALSVDGNACASCSVEVANAVEKITLDRTSIGIPSGGDAALNATVSPELTDDPGLEWTSSDPDVVRVEPVGPQNLSAKLYALKSSPDVVTVRVVSRFGPSAICEVKSYTPVTGVVLDKKVIEKLVVDSTAVLTATVSPEDAEYKDVTWEVLDPSILQLAGEDTVASIKALAPGTTKVIVTTVDGSLKDTCEVTTFLPVKSVSLDKTAIPDLEGGKTSTLTAIINPENASNKNVSWTVENPLLVSLAADGLVATLTGSATERGTTKVFVETRDGAFRDSCVVTVVDEVIHVTGVSVAPTVISSMAKGTTQTITATVLPDNATNRDVTWSAADPTVVEVSAEGSVATVKALKTGTTTVTAKTVDGALTASTTVTVITPVTGVSLNTKIIDNFDINANSTLTATVKPDDADDKSLSWTALDETVVSLTPYGNTAVVKGLKAGITKVIVETTDGSFKDTCEVKVRPDEIVIDLYFGSGTNPLGFTGTPDPQSASGDTYNYTYSYPSSTFTAIYPIVLYKGAAPYLYHKKDNLAYGTGWILNLSGANGWLKFPAIPGRYFQKLTFGSANTVGRFVRVKTDPAGNSVAQINSANATADGPGMKTLTFYTDGNDCPTASMQGNTTSAGVSYYVQIAAATMVDRVSVTFTKTLPTRP